MASGWRPTEAEIESVALQVLRVLDYIHGLHPPLVHRDIKPDNVLRTEGGRVYVVDFGGVRDVIRTASHGSTVVGTYGYMPLEQFRGAAVPASDVYGLAATLVHLLTGASPASLPQRKLRVDFRSRAHVSPALGAWLDRALEPAPEDRFQSAREAEVALRSRTAPRSRASIGRLLALVGVLVVVAGGSLAAGLRWLRVPPPAAPVSLSNGLRPLLARPPPVASLSGACVSIAGVAGRTNDLRPSPDGTTLVAAGDSTLTMWSREGQVLRTFPVPRDTRLWSAVFDPSGERVIAGGVDKTLRAYRVADGSTDWSLDVGAPIRRLEWSTDGKKLLVAAEDGTARVVDAESRRVLHVLRHGPGDVMAAVAHPDGSTIYTAGDDQTIKVWDLATGARKQTLSGHEGPVTSLAFSSGGRLLVSGSDDRSVITWSVADARALRRSAWHSAPVWTVATSPDGRYTLTGGQDRNTMLSDTATGRLLGQFAGAQVISAAFDGRGNVVVGMGGGGIAVCRLARRGLGTALPVPGPTATGSFTPRTPDERAVVEASAEVDRFPEEIDFDGLESKVRGALSRSPNLALAHVVLARIAVDRSIGAGGDSRAHYATAERELAAAAALDPKLVLVPVTRARLAMTRGDWLGAERASAAALALEPRAARARLVAAEIQERGTSAGLLAEVSSLVADTTDPYVLGRAYPILARAALAAGDVDLAEAGMGRARAVTTQPSVTRADHAELLVALGEPARALEVLADAKDGFARRPRARAEVEQGNTLLWDVDDPEAARAAFQRALVADPSSWQAHHGLAAYHRARAIRFNDASAADRSLAEIREVRRAAPDEAAGIRLASEHAAVVAAVSRRGR